ncbi:MAG TPA: bacillithiol system redox-active protein YtxJ [Chitinophagaceae bacterium]|nr:bacillithiol system redox-active protein YtxJ [Chitinophagaceae bacterium]
MEFTPLERKEQLQEIQSATGYSAVFKHNTTCPISKGVYRKLQQEEVIPGVDTVYYLDLHAHRDLSDEVASQYGIPHESPQILLIRNGQCTYHQWGYDISAEAVGEAARE